MDQIKIDRLEALKKQSPIYIEPRSTGKRFEEIKSELAELQKELKAAIQREREIQEAEHNQHTASDQDLFQKLEAANRAKQNLSRQDLAKASLKGIDLQAAELRNSNFRETNLSQANLNMPAGASHLEIASRR
ncbi:pentapeptide repeat-containing protein [Leptolyngbya sp. 7M]|uniref:pentapeptide repeat-containing protein n=1 Tax=Leptolyngbya sp. 7M TaxID=2812896 RepID=UPI001B8CD417|nr:pentapeptide repeat-containing protein [Leptolyngbya sp. 7M]QYO64380.1 pentapeptide repeat-containing protein [Leptolyngbya sp. 7M]